MLGFDVNLFEKARKLLNETLRKLIQKRKQSGRREGGLLGVLLGAKDHEKLNQLSDSQIADNIIGVIFAAHDTTASVLTWILKYLHDNPDLLEAVTVNISHVNLTPSLLINFLLLPFFYHSLEPAFYYFE